MTEFLLLFLLGAILLTLFSLYLMIQKMLSRIVRGIEQIHKNQCKIYLGSEFVENCEVVYEEYPGPEALDRQSNAREHMKETMADFTDYT
ncbi:MAG: hypothetical protein ABSB95_06475 [Dissulfurispiraceae bacterium]|jgi:hypothetical protein